MYQLSIFTPLVHRVARTCLDSLSGGTNSSDAVSPKMVGTGQLQVANTTQLWRRVEGSCIPANEPIEVQKQGRKGGRDRSECGKGRQRGAAVLPRCWSPKGLPMFGLLQHARFCVMLLNLLLELQSFLDREEASQSRVTPREGQERSDEGVLRIYMGGYQMSFLQGLMTQVRMVKMMTAPPREAMAMKT